jgi:hypothetical protein
LEFLGTAYRRRRELPWIALLGAFRTVAAGIAYIGIVALITGSIFGGTLSIGTWGALGSDPLGDRVQVYLLAFTYAVASYQYSTRAFGGVTFLRSQSAGVWRYFAETTLWMTAVVVLPLLLIMIVWGSTAWPWCVAVGLIVISLNNLAILMARRRVHDAIVASQLRGQWYRTSTVARSDDTEILRYWTPTLVSFTSMTLLLAILHWPFGALHDLPVYAVALSLINVVVLTWSQVWRQGPKLRQNLTEYMIAGESI